MAGNSSPIFTRVGDIQGGALLTAAMTAGTAYSGVDINAIPIFTSDATNGGYVQRIRFKPAGANGSATAARIFINEGLLNQVSTLAAPTTLAGTTSTAGTLYNGTFYAKVQAVDQWGGLSSTSTESTVVTTTGPGQNINWTWTASTGAASYRLYVGPTAGGEYAYFTTSTNSYNQTVAYIAGQIASPYDYAVNNMLYGEVTLPATSALTLAANYEVDYPMNIALPPGYRIIVGLAAAPTSAGWYATAIGGKY
jgi:hypothetical protein